MTKTHYFSTGKANLCIVELPEGWRNPFIDKTTLIAMSPGHAGIGEIAKLSPGNWSIIAPVKDITEEQAAAIVPEHGSKAAWVLNAGGITWGSFLEGLKLIIQREGIYTENPFEPKDILYSDELCKYCPLQKKGVYSVPGGSVAGCEGTKCEEAFENFKEQFEEAEQNVFRNSILLVNNGEVNNKQ